MGFTPLELLTRCIFMSNDAARAQCSMVTKLLKAKEKVWFLFWLLLQNRNWTTDRLRAWGWSHDDYCCLCNLQLETAEHLALHCPFAKDVRNLFVSSHPRMVQNLDEANNIGHSWSIARRGGNNLQKKRKLPWPYTFFYMCGRSGEEEFFCMRLC